MLYLRILIFLFIIAATVIASITYKKYRDTPNRYFLYLLLLTLGTECIGYSYIYFHFFPQTTFTVFFKGILPEVISEQNYWAFNIFRIITFYLYLYYFLRLLKKFKHRRYIYVILLIYTVFVILDLTLRSEGFFSKSLMWVRISGTLSILLATTFYFNEIFDSDKILNIYKELSFWLIIGSLFYYLVTVPITIFTRLFYNFQGIYVSILLLSNIVLYGCFIIGFVVNAKKSVLERGKAPY